MVQSLYSKLYNPQEIGDSRFVDRFDGDILDEAWTTFDNVGVGIFAMVDDIDEGFGITTASALNNNNEISLGNIKHFDSQACELIQIGRRVTPLASILFGFTDEPNGIQGSSVNNQLTLIENTTNTNKFFAHNNGSIPLSSIDLGIPIDTVFNRYKFKGALTFAQMFVNGILRATATTDIPTGPVQPSIQVQTLTTAPAEGRIRYTEVYNV